jgi:hypothetical protein
MIVITSCGVITALAWWSTCDRDGTEVTLTGKDADGVPVAGLVVADLRTEAEANAFLRTMTQRVHLRARRFDATGWPSHPQQRQALSVDP